MIENQIKRAIKNNLDKAIKLLNSISEEDYTNTTIAPYYASIGMHIRHVLDVFNCVLNGINLRCVDLTHRNRDKKVENSIELSLAYFDDIVTKLNTIETEDFNISLQLKDNLGFGEILVKTTLSAALMQASSHATHHYASIGYIITGLGIHLPYSDFGYNPTTPKKIELV